MNISVRRAGIGTKSARLRSVARLGVLGITAVI